MPQLECASAVEEMWITDADLSAARTVTMVDCTVVHFTIVVCPSLANCR